MDVENRILFAKIPKLIHLKYYVAVIRFNEYDERQFFSNFIRQKIVARQLVQSCDDVLAAPVERKFSQIHLIISETCDRDKYLNRALDSLKLTLIGSYPLHHAIYLESICFTLLVKISPDWSQIRNFYVKAENFLKSPGTLESVQLNYLITDGSLAVCARALRLKVPPLNLTDLGIDSDTLRSKGSIEIRERIYIMPNMKAATATTVYSYLPKSCPFDDYLDLRTYWHRVYGYELPESDEDMVYVDVAFEWTAATYIYPIVCICPCEPLQFKSKPYSSALADFTESAKKYFLNICGQSVQFNVNDDRNYKPLTKLHAASEVTDQPNLPNLCDLNKQPVASSNNVDHQPTTALTCQSIHAGLPKTRNETFICYPTPRSNVKFTERNFRPPLPPAKRPKVSDPRIESILQEVKQSSTGSPTSDGHCKFYEEMNSLARLKNLNSYTAPTLLSFCKQNNIRVKSNERKDNLMQKIYNFFSIE